VECDLADCFQCRLAHDFAGQYGFTDGNNNRVGEVADTMTTLAVVSWLT
jgi:hypothetical protein